MRFFSGAAVALAVGLILSGCYSDTQPAATTKAVPPGASGVVRADLPRLPYRIYQNILRREPELGETVWTGAYRIYQGTLPGSPDTITLHLFQERASGFATTGLYASCHRADGHPYELVGRASADSLLLWGDVGQEDARARAEAGPRWRLLCQGRTLVGTHNGQPIRLREAFPLNSLAFAAPGFSDSIIAFPGITKSPVARISLQALLPKQRTVQPWPFESPSPDLTLSINIMRDLRARNGALPNHPAPELSQIWDEQRTSYQKTYFEKVQAKPGNMLLAALSPEDFPYYEFQQHQITYVLWNQAPLLSLGFYTYRYEGGAHGGYGTDVATYDTRTGQRLRFADIFRPGTEAQLSQLLEKAVRRALHITGQSLEERLNVETLPVTHNVYLTSGGAVFVYAPYEIASYGDGEISLFISQADLQPLLIPSTAGLLSRTLSTQ
ncbi:DUF3298 domain-containing protein [Hymenobacter sp. BT664]|uniref:DUF3298 domain-containing protein n=1 Tax=Hymenobacter montanus TaxID=2771359 RepID=A0A927BID5_9BACT|nr:DUF3298 and DUF4163 domain-containing protein [Hymenobacter montanus]MBD2770537.1 DUF3298 domain-containing protein [Hymenobacter montanus]